MRCTGPYTRVLFDASDAKAARALVAALKAHAPVVRHLPQGVNGLEDFALDADFPAPDGSGDVWELRAAKYLGPKKFLGRSHIFDAALRRRDGAGTVHWEGYVFAPSLKALGHALSETVPAVFAGNAPDTVLDRDDAELHRIELCTGEAL